MVELCSADSQVHESFIAGREKHCGRGDTSLSALFDLHPLEQPLEQPNWKTQEPQGDV